MTSAANSPLFEAVRACSIALLRGDVLQVLEVSAGRGRVIDWRTVRSGETMLEGADAYDTAAMFVALVGPDVALLAAGRHEDIALAAPFVDPAPRIAVYMRTPNGRLRSFEVGAFRVSVDPIGDGEATDKAHATFTEALAKAAQVLPERRGPSTVAEAAKELGRFVLLDAEPANAESFFLARSFELRRREGLEGVVSFSDPLPRANAHGARVFAGHIGTIYQATNAVYVGRNRVHTVRLLSDGRVISDRSLAKIRTFDRNWEPAAALLEAAGAPALTERDDPRAWLRTWLPRLTRTARHPGKHVYLFGLDRAVKRALPKSQPYPKFTATPPAAIGRAA